MDFDRATQRLQRDQNKVRNRRDVGLSEKARREAQERKEQQERRAAERARQQLQQNFQQRLFDSCERKLRVNNIGRLRPYSVHGDGDKITLPPSILEQLTVTTNNVDDATATPWTFRIAIPNPNYLFPASNILQAMKPPEEDDDDESDKSSSDDEGSSSLYLDELDHKYLAYTHGSVIEFTSEEGHVGIPRLVASALLRANQSVSTFRTKDPAAMETEDHLPEPQDIEEDNEMTPGHISWGTFDLPDTLLEISLIQLPKGRSCVLTPTRQAVEKGFYNLQDVKFVLEQSLIRTRATLSRGDLVHTWHRGTQYDLNVTRVVPSSYQAVLCINTDIEVEFGHVEGFETTSQKEYAGHTLGAGRQLGDSDIIPANSIKATTPQKLLPEPPLEQKDGVCVIQIRADAAHAKRRFDARTATVSDLYAFASTIAPDVPFQLVTRFPRRIITAKDAHTKLIDAGISSGQELFMVERL